MTGQSIDAARLLGASGRSAICAFSTSRTASRIG